MLLRARGDVLRVGDHEGVLGDGHCHADDVSFLECVGAQQLGGHLVGDCDQGDGVHVCVSDCGQQVGCAVPEVAMHTPVLPLDTA